MDDFFEMENADVVVPSLEEEWDGREILDGDSRDRDISSDEESNLSEESYLDETKCIRTEGDKNENIDLKIIEWFEKKKCPFFLASDGGNLNKKEH